MENRNSSVQKEIGPDDYDLEKGEALIGFSTIQVQAEKQTKTDSFMTDKPAKQRKKNKTLIVCEKIKNVGKIKREEVIVVEDPHVDVTAVKPVKKYEDSKELLIKKSDYRTLNLRGVLRYYCAVNKRCTTMFVHKKELFSHIYNTHKKKFNCNECKKRCKSKEELKNHEKEKHPKEFILMGFLQKIPE